MLNDSQWIEKILILHNSVELAYIAGLFDAELGFGIARQGEVGKYYYQLFFDYTKMDRTILLHLSKIFGGTVKQVKDQPIYKSKMWQWRLPPSTTYFALKRVYPFLRLKKEIARICIEFFESYNPLGQKRMSAERQEIGRIYAAKLDEFKTKPYPHRSSFTESPSL